MMAGWSRHDGQITALMRDNVDTDQLIPARFMSTPRSQGYGDFLLHDVAERSTLNPDATILLSGHNFGCGSSREAAVYALLDAGFRAVIAPSFGDIFAGNAVNNGLLPAVVADPTIFDEADAQIDLANGIICQGDRQVAFDLDPVWRTKLLNGWDDIDLTASFDAQINTFHDNRIAEAPWLLPDPNGFEQGAKSF